jgi:hypothetical protein
MVMRGTYNTFVAFRPHMNARENPEEENGSPKHTKVYR